MYALFADSDSRPSSLSCERVSLDSCLLVYQSVLTGQQILLLTHATIILDGVTPQMCFGISRLP